MHQPKLKKLHDDYKYGNTILPALYSNRWQLCDAYDIEINYGKQILDVLNQIGEYSLDEKIQSKFEQQEIEFTS